MPETASGVSLMKLELGLTAALSAIMMTISPAVAADMPKTGSFHIKSTATGSSRFVILGKGESHLDIWEEQGKAEGEGLLSNMTTKCFGVGETLKGISETPQGHCVYRDADGDQIVYRTGIEKHNQERALARGWGQAILGTGKYEAIVASYVVTCELMGPSSGYTNACEGQGSYILP
jgi:hypothetical protein